MSGSLPIPAILFIFRASFIKEHARALPTTSIQAKWRRKVLEHIWEISKHFHVIDYDYIVQYVASVLFTYLFMR